MRRARTWLALVLLGLAAAAEANDDAAQAISPLQRRARELSWSGDYEESLALYGRLRAERPADLALAEEIGRVLLWAGREEEALAYFEQVLATDPADANVRLLAGRALHYEGRTGEAVGHYRLALPAPDKPIFNVRVRTAIWETDAAVIKLPLSVLDLEESRWPAPFTGTVIEKTRPPDGS